MELAALLTKLKLDHLHAQVDSVCEQAAQRQEDYKSFLQQALQAAPSGYPQGRDRRLIRELSGMGFVERTQNLILLGPPGVGKTHLSIAFGIKAVEAGYSVLFLTLEALMTRLNRALHENRLDRALQQLTYPKLLIIDEVGYLPLTRTEATLFFRLVVRRYERASLLITSNKSFLDWGDMFNDSVLATAVLDRLLHYSTTLNIKGESYRLKEKRKAGLLGRTIPPQSTDFSIESAAQDGPSQPSPLFVSLTNF